MTDRTLFSVVIIDDDVAFAESLRCLLEAHGFSTQVFSSAEAFISNREKTPRPAVALVDVRLPGKGGIELLAELKDEALIATIMMTGHGDVPLAVRAIQKGALEFIEKPFPEHKLLTAIEVASEELEAGLSAWRNERTQVERLAQLTPREKDVLKMVSDGLSSKQIGRQLGLSVRTVEMHRANLVRRLGMRTLAEALALYLEVGELD